MFCHRQNPPFVPAKPKKSIEIHSVYSSFTMCSTMFYLHTTSFCCFFLCVSPYFWRKKNPSILDKLLWYVHPIFSQVFPTKINLFTIFSPFFQEIHPKNRSFGAAAQSAWPPWDGSSPGGWPPAAWSPSPGDGDGRVEKTLLFSGDIWLINGDFMVILW